MGTMGLKDRTCGRTVLLGRLWDWGRTSCTTSTRSMNILIHPHGELHIHMSRTVGAGLTLVEKFAPKKFAEGLNLRIKVAPEIVT